MMEFILIYIIFREAASIHIQQIEKTVESQSSNISVTVTDESNDKIVNSFSV